MRKITVLFIAFILCLMPVCRAAQMSVGYGYDQNKLTINASLDLPYTDASFFVVSSGEDINTLSDTNLPLAADYLVSDNEGKIKNYELYLPSYLTYGKYTAYLYFDEYVLSDSFSYLSPDEILAAKKAEILKSIKNSKDWSELKNSFMGTDVNEQTINDNLSIIAPDFTSYNKLKAKGEVFTAMYLRLSEIKVFDDIADLFEKISSERYSIENPPSKTDDGNKNPMPPMGGGFSGGSGGSGGGTYVAPPAELPDTDNKPFDMSFPDMENHWAQTTVYDMYKKGIINGFEDGSFRPDIPVTRAEFVKMAVCAFEIEGAKTNAFDDVRSDDWFSEYVNTAYDRGIVRGNGTFFYPNSSITREDAAVILYGTLKLFADIEGTSLSFADGNEISDYAKEAIEALYNKKIVQGALVNRFLPKDHTTRAEAATLISRAFDYYLAH